MRRLALLALCCLSLASPVASAQTGGSAVITATRTHLGVGDLFDLHVAVDLTGQDADAIEPPDLSEFEVVRQSMQQPMSMRFGFGQQQPVVRMSRVYNYTLRATHAGRFEIGPAVVRLGSRRLRSNAVEITVDAGGGTPPPPDPGGPNDDVKPDPWDDPGVDVQGLNGAHFDEQAFLQTTVDRADPFVGQQVTVTIYLYTRAPLGTAPAITTQPSTEGFWTRDLLPQNRNFNPHVQRVGGRPFRVYLLERFAAFPLREGELTIGAPAVSLRAGSLFDIFQAPQTLSRQGVPVVVQARALPPGGPAQGAVVGHFRIQTSLDRHQVGTGDAVTLTATIEGRGNLEDVRLDLPAIDGIRALAPRVDDDVSLDRDRVGGTRRMEWLLVPERPGSYSIPALGFHQFDPDADPPSWSRVEAPALDLTAAGNAIGTTPQDDGTDATHADAEPASPDEPLRFRPIHPHSELHRARAPVSASAFYPFALAAPPLLFVLFGLGFAFARRRREGAGADPRRAAHAAARAHLATAQRAAKSGAAREVYDALSDALLEAAGGSIAESARGLTMRQLHEGLTTAGADDELAQRVVNELESCDFARFSAAGVEADEMAQALKRTQALVQRLTRLRPPEGSP